MKGRNMGLVVITVVLILSLVAGACGPAALEEEKEVVTTAVVSYFTGPLGQAGNCAFPMIDYGRYLNEQGGINGVEINTLWADVAASVPLTITAYRRFAGAGAVAIHSISSSGTEMITPMAQKDGIPLFHQGGTTAGLKTKPIPWVFTAINRFSWSSTAFMKWFKDNWTEPRPVRFGMMVTDVAGSWDCLRGAEEVVDRLGMEYVGHEVVPLMGVLDTTVELLRLAEKEPDFIYGYVVGATGSTIIKDAARLKLQEKGISLASYEVFDETQIKVGGEDAEGWYIAKAHPSIVETELPGMKTLLEIAKKYRGWEPEEVPSYYVLGWFPAIISYEAIRIAIDKVGFENLTGRAVREAIVSIRDFDTGLVPLITIRDDKPWYLDYERIYQVQQGKIVPVSDWMKPPE